MGVVLLLYNKDAQAQAERVATTLAALGWGVEQYAGVHVPPRRIALAERVIVLWSERTGRSAALRAAARRAHAREKLICLRLGAARPPRAFPTSAFRNAQSAGALRPSLERALMPIETAPDLFPPPRTSRGAGFAAAIFVAAAIAAALYASDQAFAQRVNDAASDLQHRAIAFASSVS